MITEAALNLDDAGRAKNCPVCGSASQGSLEIFNSYEMARCRDCSLVYTVLRTIPREQYEEVYSGEADYLEMVEVAEKTAQGPSFSLPSNAGLASRG